MGWLKENAVKIFKVFHYFVSACTAIACAVHAFFTHEIDGEALTNASFSFADNRLLRRHASLFLIVVWFVSALNTIIDCFLPYCG